MSHLTTEQMQAAVAKVHGTPVAIKAAAKEEIIIADVLADTAEAAVATVLELGDTLQSAGNGILSFGERVKTRYEYQRAVRKGLITPASTFPSSARKARKEQ